MHLRCTVLLRLLSCYNNIISDVNCVFRAIQVKKLKKKLMINHMKSMPV